MTITNENNLTKEAILDKWNNTTIRGSGDYAYSPERRDLENRIASLLQVEYFNESVQKMPDSYLWDARKHQLSDEEKKKLDLYREIFEWKEDYEIRSTWNIRAYSSQVESASSLDEIKTIIESRNPDESLTEPEFESQYQHWDGEMQHFYAEVILGDLQLRKTDGDKLEAIRNDVEKTHSEISELHGMAKELESLSIALSISNPHHSDLQKEINLKIITIFNKVGEIYNALNALNKKDSSSEKEEN